MIARPLCRDCGCPADGYRRGMPLCLECLAKRQEAARLAFYRGVDPEAAPARDNGLGLIGLGFAVLAIALLFLAGWTLL